MQIKLPDFASQTDDGGTYWNLGTRSRSPTVAAESGMSTPSTMAPAVGSLGSRGCPPLDRHRASRFASTGGSCPRLEGVVVLGVAAWSVRSVPWPASPGLVDRDWRLDRGGMAPLG